VSVGSKGTRNRCVLACSASECAPRLSRDRKGAELTGVSSVRRTFPRFSGPLPRRPTYISKQVKYALLGFGPEAKTRIWLAQDGNALYVDNGNGPDRAG
jgi:hypothetical protein